MEQDQTTFNKKVSSSTVKLFLGLSIIIVATLIWFQLGSEKDEAVNNNELTINNEQKQIRPAEMKPQDGMSFLFENKEYSLKEGETLTVAALGEPNGKKITAVDLHFVFDPKLVKLEKIEPTETYSLILSDAKIDNEKGLASIAMAVPLESESVANNNAMANLTFTGLSKGKAVVSFSDKAVAAAENETGNVVSVRGSSIININ